MVLTIRPEPGLPALEAAFGAKDGPRLRASNCPLGRGPGAPARALPSRGGHPDEVFGPATAGAEGNPFFVEQRIASLVETGALARSEAGGWRLDRSAPRELPEAIERLVRAHVDRLGSGARQAVVAALVLGPEPTLGEIGALADLGEGDEAAVYELCRAGLLVELRRLPQPPTASATPWCRRRSTRACSRNSAVTCTPGPPGPWSKLGGTAEEVAGQLGHRWEKVVDLGRRCLELARRVGNRRYELSLLVGRLLDLYRLGRWDDALAMAAEETRSVPRLAQQVVDLVPVHVARGETDRAAALLADLAEAATSENSQLKASYAWAHAGLLLAQGRPADALAVLEPVLALGPKLGLTSTHFKQVLVAALEACECRKCRPGVLNWDDSYRMPSV